MFRGGGSGNDLIAPTWMCPEIHTCTTDNIKTTATEDDDEGQKGLLLPETDIHLHRTDSVSGGAGGIWVMDLELEMWVYGKRERRSLN